MYMRLLTEMLIFDFHIQEITNVYFTHICMSCEVPLWQTSRQTVTGKKIWYNLTDVTFVRATFHSIILGDIFINGGDTVMEQCLLAQRSPFYLYEPETFVLCDSWQSYFARWPFSSLDVAIQYLRCASCDLAYDSCICTVSRPTVSTNGKHDRFDRIINSVSLKIAIGPKLARSAFFDSNKNPIKPAD